MAMTSTPVATDDPVGQASHHEQSPRLSSHGLTGVLFLMCAIPIVTITLMWWFLPPVKLNELKAAIEVLGAPPNSYYELPFDERNYLPEIQIQITNAGNDEWTNMYIRVNHNYSFHDSSLVLAPGESREFALNRFSSRTGAFFDMRYNPVKEVMIYARLPDRSRATYYESFVHEAVGEGGSDE